MANILTDPPFAANPPVKVNIDAKILGLVLGILAVIGAVFGLIGLLAAFGACTVLGATINGCGTPILWILGELVLLVGYIVGAIGGFRMYQMNREGREWVIYGLALGVAGNLIYLIGNIVFYSSAFFGGLGVGYSGAIVSFIISFIVYFIVYYLVVIARFPGEAPMVPRSMGGYGAPPPPPPA